MKHIRLGSAMFALGAVLASACSGTENSFVVGGGQFDASAPGPGFDVPDSSSPPAPSETLNQCVSTECVYPYASCSPEDGTLPMFKCGTDLANDKKNCGECGHVCDDGWAMTVVCHQGECRNTDCNDGYGDCNGVVDDGCESYFREDANNCGGCGIVCAPGVRCLNFYCGGCPPGQVTCGNDGCVDINVNSKHCGRCGFNCWENQPDGGLPPAPPNMYYGCAAGTCSQLLCVEDSVHTWANCNGKIDDGCEIDLAAADPELGLPFHERNNCGTCGNVCPEGKLCFAFPSTGQPDCQCHDGFSRCEDRCADLENDPFNCGACGFSCDGASTHNGATNVCVKGRCATDCVSGLSDCNQNPVDGCESDILRDPKNCGGCGIRCDVSAGQPCVNGQCLTKPCEGPPR